MAYVACAIAIDDFGSQRELSPCCQTIRGAGLIFVEQSLVRKNPKHEGSMQTIGNRVKHVAAGFLAVIACSATLMLSLEPTASASPWPQQRGDGLLISSVSYLEANNSLANANPAVGNGTFSRLDLGFYSEYGLTDTLTLGAATRLERVRLRGSSVSGETSGIIDVELFARPVLWRGQNSIFAAQGMIIVPTGYSLDRKPATGSRVGKRCPAEKSARMCGSVCHRRANEYQERPWASKMFPSVFSN
jgi:hypothetical protein